MNTQPNPFSKPTLPQSPGKREVEQPAANLWIQGLILHAPLIGLGFGLATGLCLLTGISLRILLSPEIHGTTPVVSVPVSPVSPSEQPAEGALPQTNGVRIVVPAPKSFQVTSIASEANHSATSSKGKTLALVLGIGGIVLGSAGFWALRWIVMHANPQSLATVTPSPVKDIPQTYLPPAVAPLAALPTDRPLDPSALTINYRADDGVSEPAIGSENALWDSSEPSEVDSSALAPVDLAHLMDIRKRRPHS